MRAKGLVLLVLAALLWQAPVAGARDSRQGFGLWLQSDNQQRKLRPDRRPRDSRETREPRQDRRNRNRLTDEERRELHRDLDRAHREIYRR